MRQLNNLSLRTYMMDIRSASNPAPAIFHSIDSDAKLSDRTIFTCHKEVYPEAQSICANLVLYMQKFIGKDKAATVNQCFTTKAVTEACGQWDKESKQVVTKAQLHARELQDLDQGPGYNNVIVLENIKMVSNTPKVNIPDDNNISATTQEKKVLNKVMAICKEVEKSMQQQSQQKTNQVHLSMQSKSTTGQIVNSLATITVSTTSTVNPAVTIHQAVNAPATHASMTNTLSTVPPTVSTDPNIPTSQSSCQQLSTSSNLNSGTTGNSSTHNKLQNASSASKRPSSPLNAAGSNKSGQKK